MTELKFYKLNVVPVTWEPNAFYIIKGTYNDGTSNIEYAETYVTNNLGVARAVGNAVMIDEIVTKKIADLTGPGSFKIVADIAARNAIVSTTSYLVLVLDASADVTVTSGAALYAYDSVLTTFHKVAEYESMDITIDWSDIQNGPTSTVTAIDQAVTDSHTHPNKATIDKLSEVEGKLQFDAKPLGNNWETTPEW